MSSMRISTVVLSLVFLAACGQSGQPTPPADSDTDPVLPEAPEDTAVPLADEGSLMLTRKLNANGTKTVNLFGIFVDEHSGYINAAQCAITNTPCFDFLPPDEDTSVEIDVERLFVPEVSDFRYVGLDVGLGDWSATYVNGPAFPYYFADLTPILGQESVRGWFGARFDGQWGEYQGERDIYISPDIELIYPKANSTISFHDSDDIRVEWVPDGAGTIFLTVTETGLNASLARLYMLEDDGYFEFPSSELGFGVDPETVNFKLARWNWGSVKKNGHELEIVATSEVSFSGDYFHVGGRDKLELSDKCLPATTMPPLTSGNYWGELADAGFKDDLSDTDHCTDGLDANAADGFIRVELAPNQFLGVTYDLPDNDASIYLVRDCTNADTCVVGADENDDGITESLSYFNATDETEILYLVLDGTAQSTGLFFLDVTLDTLLEPDMYNTCPEAILNATPMVEGSYYTSYLPYTGSIDPGAGGCTGTALTGPESIGLITLQNNETLTASITMDGADPAIYLAYNCANVSGNACPVGDDNSIGSKEAINYQNTSGGSENLWLVIDTKGQGLKPYFLVLDIN